MALQKIKKKYSLMVGRFQPLHEGHIKMIKTVLKCGQPVLVGVRDTEMDENNPYTYEERKDMLEKEFNDEIRIMSFPDIDAIYVGRDVGYKVIKLDKETESISGTKIRRAMNEQIITRG